jgi:hypothetical protein
MTIAGLSAKVSRKRRRVARAVFRVDAETAVELGFGALQRRMHDIAAKDDGCLRRPHHDADMAGCVPRPRLDPYVVVEGVVR